MLNDIDIILTMPAARQKIRGAAADMELLTVEICVILAVKTIDQLITAKRRVVSYVLTGLAAHRVEYLSYRDDVYVLFLEEHIVPSLSGFIISEKRSEVKLPMGITVSQIIKNTADVFTFRVSVSIIELSDSTNAGFTVSDPRCR